MHHSFQLVLQFCQLRFDFLRGRDAFDGEVAFPSCPARMRETQKIKRLGWTGTTLRSSLGRIASELDQPRLLGMQFQVKLGKPFLECSEVNAGPGAGVSPC